LVVELPETLEARLANLDVAKIGEILYGSQILKISRARFTILRESDNVATREAPNPLICR